MMSGGILVDLRHDACGYMTPGATYQVGVWEGLHFKFFSYITHLLGCFQLYNFWGDPLC